MSRMLIDILLRVKKYDIYSNSKMKDGNIKTLARIIAKNKEIDLQEYIVLTKCKNKFCWDNFIFPFGNCVPVNNKL